MKPRAEAHANTAAQTKKAASQPKWIFISVNKLGESAAPRLPHMLPQPSAAPTFLPPTSCANAHVEGLLISTNNAIAPSAITACHGSTTFGTTMQQRLQQMSATPIGPERPQRGPYLRKA